MGLASAEADWPASEPVLVVVADFASTVAAEAVGDVRVTVKVELEDLLLV